MQPKFVVRFIQEGGEKQRFLIPSRLARTGAQLPNVPGSYQPNKWDVISMMEVKYRKAIERAWPHLTLGIGTDTLTLHITNNKGKPSGTLQFKLEQIDALPRA